MKKKFEVWLPLMFSVVMIIGMYLGYRFSSAQPGDRFFKLPKSSALQEALEIIKLKYVDSVRSDTLEAAALTEMMNRLDPHSVYLPPVQLEEATEDLSGNFQGIGVEFNLIRDTVNVTYVIKNGPSEKAGIQIGDQIIRVNDSSLVQKNVTSLRIRNLIRGPQGSKVALLILRHGKPLTVAVTREYIPSPSVIAAYMVDKHIGYIKLDKFTTNSYREFMGNADSLKKLGMNEMIFDLRGNGGGYMEQAVDIVDEFLDGDKLIVYTLGTNSPKKEYRCKRPGIFETGKVVVLVDELSASASEIVSGALQDWDRATIVGRRTFGKGLVQELFPLSDGSAIKLTVSRYYTPLGRSIQKPYSQGKKVYMDEVWERYANGQAFYADSNKVKNGKQYRTPGGRLLYGGGGIMPDIFVGLDTARASAQINRLFFSGSFNDFLFHYYLQNPQVLNAYKDVREYTDNFQLPPKIWHDFVTWARKDSVNLSVIPAEEKQRVEYRMAAYLARFKWRDPGFYQVFNKHDPAFIRAVEALKNK